MDFLRKLGFQISSALRRFMMGRYGSDKLNMALLIAGVAMSVISMFVLQWQIKMLLTLLCYALMGIVIFRTLSRNTYKRYQENRKFLQIVDRIKDRKNKYYKCPRCRQVVRVPKGKGKVSITCPKCKEKFIKKT